MNALRTVLTRGIIRAAPLAITIFLATAANAQTRRPPDKKKKTVDRRPQRDRRHRNSPIRSHLKGSDQHQRIFARDAGQQGDQVVHRYCSFHARSALRRGVEQHQHPRDFVRCRRGHDGHLHRRHADSDSRTWFQFRQFAAGDFRPRPGRGFAGTTGYAVRRGIRGRHDPLYHAATEPDGIPDVRSRGSIEHRSRRSQLRSRGSGWGRPSSPTSWGSA